jgi:hypothetical protein
MTPDADAAFVVADLIKDVLLSQVRARLYASVYEMGMVSDPCGVNETAKSRADAAVNAFDDAFPRQPISQESP